MTKEKSELARRVYPAIYELVEWVGGAYLGDATAKAFVGAQNDPWDSQKDMALAVAGAFVSLLMVSCVIRQRRRRYLPRVEKTTISGGDPVGAGLLAIQAMRCT